MMVNILTSLRLLQNENGATMISNAIVAGLLVVLLALFGETVATCYQYLSLQHSMNEGLRAGIIQSSDPKKTVTEQEDFMRGNARARLGTVASQLNVNNTNNSKSSFVSTTSGDVSTSSGVSIDEVSKTKWLKINVKKSLLLSRVLDLISPSSGDRLFNFDFTGQTKLQ
jgi:Flp pilus assembly pilin Flp